MNLELVKLSPSTTSLVKLKRSCWVAICKRVENLAIGYFNYVLIQIWVTKGSSKIHSIRPSRNFGLLNNPAGGKDILDEFQSIKVEFGNFGVSPMADQIVKFRDRILGQIGSVVKTRLKLIF